MIEISQIPTPSNHKLVGFEEIKHIDEEQPSLYKPVYERVFSLGGIYWDENRKERIYLLNDNYAYTCEGDLIDVSFHKFEKLNSEDVRMFYTLLRSNGYEFDMNQELKPITYWRPVYTIEEGFSPLSCKTTDEYFNMFKMWGEIYELRQDCANWCNKINKALRRNYPEVE